MASPVSFPCFSGLSDSERNAMQSITFGRGFADVTTPTVHTPTPESAAHRVGGKVPIIVHPAPSTALRDKVARTPATSAIPTTIGVSWRLRSIVVRGDSLAIFVPTYPEPRQPLGSFFDSLTKDQRRNLKRRLRRITLMSFRRAQAGQSLADSRQFPSVTPVGQSHRDEQAIPVSSNLLSGSRFHPLSATPEEEDAARIARASPRPLEFDPRVPSPSRVAY